MKNKVLMPFLIFIFISIIVFLGLFSCSSDTTKPQNLEELEKPFGIPHSEKPAIPKSFNIIVDASQVCMVLRAKIVVFSLCLIQ